MTDHLLTSNYNTAALSLGYAEPRQSNRTQQQLWHTEVERPEALLLVAHPDDELLFAGGLLHAYPKWNWSIAAVTTPSEERLQQWAKSALLLRERGVNVATRQLDLEDKYPHDPYLWTERIVSALDPTVLEWDIVFTHGARGEYGNLHHIAVHHAAHALFKNVWDFFAPCFTKQQPQLLKSRVNAIRYNGLSKQQLIKEAYPIEYESLWMHDPDLMDTTTVRGYEYFTSDVEPVNGESWPPWRWA